MSTPHRTPETSTLDVQLLLSSFLKIEPQADDFATSFYQILFHKYPKVQSLFSETDMEKQKDKLIQSLQMVMGNVNNPEAFTSILKNLGKRHVAYGAVLTDYPLIGDALLQALEKHLGKDWTDEVKQTWTLAYQTIAETMAEGTKVATKNDVNPMVSKSIDQSDTNQPKQNLNHYSSDEQTTSSGSKSIPIILILLIGFGIAAIGYITIKPTLIPATSLEQNK
jgi:hemoglobin-like flavoprotein